MSKIKTVTFNLGYAETTSYSCLILNHDVGFDTPKELLQDWYETLKEIVKKEREYKERCTKHCKAKCYPDNITNPLWKWCPICGNELIVSSGEPSDLDIQDRYISLFKEDNQSGHCAWETMQKRGWELFGRPMRGRYLIVGNFETLFDDENFYIPDKPLWVEEIKI